MEDIEDRGYRGSKRLDVADIDARLRRLSNLTAAQLIIDRVAKLTDIPTRQISSGLRLGYIVRTLRDFADA